MVTRVFLSSMLLAVAAVSTTASGEETQHPITSDCHCEEPESVHGRPLGLSFGVGAGLAYFTEDTPFGTDIAIGRALALGYTLSLRGSFEILPWLAIDARGRLLHNDGNDLVREGSLTTTGGLGAVRFTWPLPHIKPYILGGMGGYHITASGNGSSAKGKASELVNDGVPAVELGLGAIAEAGRGVEVGIEYTYSHLLGETLSTNPNADGGDPSSVSLFVQYHFKL